MLHRLVIIILICLPVLSQAQQKKYLHFDQNWNQAVTEALRLYSCEVYMNYDGAFNGPMKCFNIQTDSLIKFYNFQDNQLHGEVKEYYNDGTLKLSAKYNKGLPIDEWMEWDASGELVVHKTYDESSRILKDYFVEETPYETALAFSNKQEEPPVYTSECILTKIDKVKYLCSQDALNTYYNNPPKPPQYLTSKAGQTFVTLLRYELSDRGAVLQAEILQSCGDPFLDELAEIHVLNMVPFESAKQYGNPINYWMEAEIVFAF